MIEVDDKVIESVQCVVCDTDIADDDKYTTDARETVCSDCMRMCERCDAIGTESDDWHTVDESIWCDICTRYNANLCDSCGEYSTESTCELLDTTDSFCVPCIEDMSYCDECDGYYIRSCGESHDDDDFEDSTRIIHDYSYRPDAIFHSTDKNERLYFGIEIEVESPRNRREASTYAQRLEPLELAYLKNDGSLTCGFEIVTHPMSHDFYKNEAGELWNTLEKLRTEYNVKAWDATSCGLHIHISRTGFSSGAHMHRFLNLVYSNQPLYETLAGRESERWAKFTDVLNEEQEYNNETGRWSTKKTTRSFLNKIKNGRDTDRYSAVNMQNRETLEMRIFRSSVNSDAVKSQLDLAHASVEYTRTLSVKQVINGALTQSAFMKYILENESTYMQLVYRIRTFYPQLANVSV